MASSRASSNITTTYSYLNSRLNTGNYSNIIDSTTGLISADAYANCMDSYYACMDEICTARSAAKGRCSCAGRATNFLAAEEALERANEELITLSGQLSLLIATKGKGDDLAAAFSLTEAEQVMNCVSWQEITDKVGVSGKEAIDWCSAHGIYGESGGEVSSCNKPNYCNKSGNNFGFEINDLKNIKGSSSDILAQLKAWADAKDKTKQYTTDDTNTLIKQYNSSISYIVNQLRGVTLNVENADKDTLALKWGYHLYEYAHNNVCGRVLDSCFNGIYEACGTPPTVKDSDGKSHTKCMNGATTSCPFNYNSYISVDTNTSSDKYGDIKLNERGSSSTNSSTSAACFGYTATSTTGGVRATSSVSTNDPYYSLRGPVADARRSIMQKYLLDANSACDTYGENLKNIAQNINYQKVAAQQALQQKRLEFRQQEETSTESNYVTYADNFVSCLDEIWDCYLDYAESESGWTTARIKTYCAQKSQVPHCYEPMVCSPSRLALTAVIDKPDVTDCIFAQDFRNNTCRNVVTISEILYGANSQQTTYNGYESLAYSDTTKINSAYLRESCLQEADVGTLRAWGKDAPATYRCTIAEVHAKDPNARAGYKDSETDTTCKYITACNTGYFVDETTGTCKLVSVDCTDTFEDADGVAHAERAINDDYALDNCIITECKPHYSLNTTTNKCVPDTADCGSVPNATSATAIWDGDAFICKATACNTGYTLYDGACYKNTIDCTSAELNLLNAAAGTKTWNASTNSYNDCTVSACNTGYTLYDGACYKNTISCTTAELNSLNATAGTKTWNTSYNNYGVCKATSCYEYYSLSSDGTCKRTTINCTQAELNSLYATAGTKTWNASTNSYSDCTITDCKPNAHVDGNVCKCDSGYVWSDNACVVEPTP